MTTIASMDSPCKKRPFDDDHDQQGPSSTLLSPPKRQKVGNDGYNGNGDGDDDRESDADSDGNGNDGDDIDDDDDDSKPELALKSRDDEPFPLDFEDRKLFMRRACSDDGDTSSKSLDSVDYHIPDNSDDGGGGSSNDNNDDAATGEFSDEDW
jgi:hypothetical protein